MFVDSDMKLEKVKPEVKVKLKVKVKVNIKVNKHNYELQWTALGIQTEESDDCDKEIMYGPVMFYKLHGKFKTVTVNDVYLKINF